MKVYIAAPLFSPSERAFNDSLAEALERTAGVYLPQRDGILVEQHLKRDPRAALEICKRVFVEDLDAIRQANVIVAVLEGRALDEGVCIEVGFAKALGKTIVGYKSDIRICLPWGSNPLVTGCVDAWVESIAELHSLIKNYGGRNV